MLKIYNIKEENLNPIIAVLMKRDNMTIVEAINYFLDAVHEWEEISAGFSYDDACEFIEDWFALEEDYLVDFLTSEYFN